MPNLKIDVSHPWDGKTPIRVPERNKDTLPSVDEVVEVLQYFLENEPMLIVAMVTEYDMKDFFTEGNMRNANI